ncbi:MAG: glycosyltransferase family 4 protein [Sphingobium sp.]
MADAPPSILHLHSGFNLGGKEARAVRLMNLWGGRARHSIISADPQARGAAAAIAPDVACDFPHDVLPPLHGLPGLRRYWRWAQAMRRFDLVLSYNWGAMDGVMAHRLFSPFLKLPALIHHEDGFNEDEAERLKSKRNHFRRLALARADALVVPSARLHAIARTVWRQPESRVRQIANGIDVDAYAIPPRPNAIPGLIRSAKPPEKLIVGTLAGLRAVKNLPRLVRAVAPLKDRLQLVIVGEGPERDAILSQARALGVEDIHLPGFLPTPSHYVGLFDIFALSSDSEQFPISLVEAMAAGLPVVSTDVGDVRTMVAAPNRDMIVPAQAEAAMTAAFARLCGDGVLRAALGEANRRKARQEYREADMVRHYAALYEGAMGQPGALSAS